VGELGWELYIPAESALHVYEQLLDAGQAHGLAHAGFHAMAACRIEKGYRHWGHDIGVEDTPLHAGLGFTCAWDKPGGFRGRDALLRQRDAGVPHRRLVQMRLEDPQAVLHHDEPILSEGRVIGLVTSAAYGHRVEASLAMGYVWLDEPVTAQRLAGLQAVVEVAGRPVGVQLQLAPFYDPSSLRVKPPSAART